MIKEIITEAKLEKMEAVLEFVNAQIEDWPTKIQNQIGVAVDEIFSNIARYAYQSGAGAAIVRIAVDDDITIEFEDSGVAYDPLAKEDPNTTLTAEERDIGGLGIFMVKKIMDAVEYRHEGGKNILTIKKSM